MSGGVSYYGSKISLISNAGIRYEGHLFSVDTTESTVTLSKVCSHGTEDRVCDHPVAKRDEMYDFIVFRGSDIKDLLVCEPPKQPPTTCTSIAQDPAILQHSGAVSTTTPSFRPPSTFVSAPAPFAPFNVPYQYGAIGGMMPNQFGGTQPPRPPHMHDMGRHTPPLPRRSPTMEQAVQASGPQSPAKDKTDTKQQKRDDEKHAEKKDAQPQPQPQRRRGSREERRINKDIREQRDHQDLRDHDQYRDKDRDDDKRKGDRSKDQGRRQQQQQQGQQPYRRGRGRGRGPRSPMPKEPIKVGTDFDFDSANAQFDKTALEDEVENKLKIVNGDEKVGENEGSGSETPTSENQDDKAFYEPEKSFFDSISCEATTSGNRTRPSRREEYKINTETFGVPYARGRGRGRGGYYRGGFRGGYNYRGNYNRSGYNNSGYRGRGNFRGNSWNNRRRNDNWGRNEGFQRRDRDDNPRQEASGTQSNKGSTDTSQKEDKSIAQAS